MDKRIRNCFPYIAGGFALIAIIWAISFGTLPKADFNFNNGTEVKTVDPPVATGSPEGRVINAIFEGLYRNQPLGMEFDDEGNITKYPKAGDDGNVPMTVVPAIAESHTLSDDGKVYTFKIRASARWSNGEPITAPDFEWSWLRMLHPEIGSRYAYQLTSYVVNADQYNAGQVNVGDPVEVEFDTKSKRRKPNQPFPRARIVRGVLMQIGRPPEPDFDSLDKVARSKAEVAWKNKWVYVVKIGDSRLAYSKEPQGHLKRFEFETAGGDGAKKAKFTGEIRMCHTVLFDFKKVGIRAKDDRTLVVTLKNRTPFFLDLVAFYPLYPVNRRCVEKYGTPSWTKSENIVCSGPFKLEFRRIRDRVRVVKNPEYWNAKVVQLNSIDAFAVESETTSLNMYLNGQLDWSTTVPSSVIPELMDRDDFYVAPALITYFYRLNVERPPLDDVHVRRALNMAIDKRLICEKVTRAGQQPARSIVPPGIAGYASPMCGEFDPAKAKLELEKSKYKREGKKLPKITIIYNTNEGHRNIAEVIQQQWKNNLGIDVGLSNMEWGSFLDTVHQTEYAVARAGWIGDYPDPNTFVDMWLTDGANNETNWSSKEYDNLVNGAAAETDPQQRLRMLERAEGILMDEQPIIPVYFYVSVNMAQTNVKGFFANIQDLHPLHLIRVED